MNKDMNKDLIYTILFLCLLFFLSNTVEEFTIDIQKLPGSVHWSGGVRGGGMQQATIDDDIGIGVWHLGVGMETCTRTCENNDLTCIDETAENRWLNQNELIAPQIATIYDELSTDEKRLQPYPIASINFDQLIALYALMDPTDPQPGCAAWPSQRGAPFLQDYECTYPESDASLVTCSETTVVASERRLCKCFPG
jgi:hypothetical protein